LIEDFISLFAGYRSLRAPSRLAEQPLYPVVGGGGGLSHHKSFTLGGWRTGGGSGARSLDYASDTDAVQSPPR
jgi:hypothetical protein